MEKYVKKPYVRQDWPKMVYHPKTGEPLKCATLDEVPEGYLLRHADVGKDLEAIEIVEEAEAIEQAEAKAIEDARVEDAVDTGEMQAKPRKAKAEAPKTARKKKAQSKQAKPKKSPLEKMKLTRAEAETLLTAENVKFSTEDSDTEIAAIIKELLSDEGE